MLYGIYCFFMFFVMFTAWSLLGSRYYELRGAKRDSDASYVAMLSTIGFVLSMYHLVDVRFSIYAAIVVAAVAAIVGLPKIAQSLRETEPRHKKWFLVRAIVINLVVIFSLMFLSRFIP